MSSILSSFQPFFIVIKEKPLGTIRADIVHAFLTVSIIFFMFYCFCLFLTMDFNINEGLCVGELGCVWLTTTVFYYN